MSYDCRIVLFAILYAASNYIEIIHSMGPSYRKNETIRVSLSLSLSQKRISTIPIDPTNNVYNLFINKVR